MKTTKTQKGAGLSEDQAEKIISDSRKIIANLERELAIQENDLSRSQANLYESFGITTFEEAMEKAEELSSQIPEIKKKRDKLLIEIQLYLDGIK